MKKLLLLGVSVFVVATPAMAASPTKGTKSYQAAKSDEAQQPADVAAAETPADPSKIEPAAGDTADAGATSDEGKSFKEEIRLPRK